jgi:hypothetical protein
MSENGNDTIGQKFGQAIARLIEGGLPRLLLSKPVQEAIGRLVYAASDIPTAKLEQWAQNVRNDTAAQKQFTEAIILKAKAIALDDPALIERGLGRWTRQLGRRQSARENVAARTLMSLSEADIPEGTEAPSEEFMGLFEDIAEKASSDELADLLARILAGEIRKPRSVSRRTLQVAAILDAEIVGALNMIRPYLFSSNWVHVPPSKSEEWRGPLALLNSVSIVNALGPRTLTESGKSQAVLIFRDEVLLIDCKPALITWFVDGVNLTPIGIELVSVFPFSDEISIEHVGHGFREHHQFVQRVQIGSLSEDGSTIDMNSVRDLDSQDAPGINLSRTASKIV